MKHREPPFLITPINIMNGAMAPTIVVQKNECNNKHEKAIEIAQKRSRLSSFHFWDFI